MGIPARIHVSSAAAQAQRYAGELPLKQLPRLVELLANAEGQLQVDVQLQSQDRHAALRGVIHGELPLLCQRCQKVFAWPLQSEIDWRLVADEATERALMQECEPLLVENDELPLREAIEDEVLLAFPLLPRCESCENEVAAQPVVEAVLPEEEPRRENPFAALKKQLKSD